LFAGAAPLTGLRICYFGRYDQQYPRNAFLIKCFERAGAEVTSIRDDRGLAMRTPSLVRRALSSPIDLLVVAFRAHSDMLAARAIARFKDVPLMFDPLTSRYEEKVTDRKLVGGNSLLGRWYHATDKAGFRLADRVLLETDAHIDFFCRTFGVPRAKCRRVFLGADEEIMRPLGARSESDRFTVFFYGRFSPLHGVEHIVRAAAMLEERREPVDFVVVGAGQTYQASRALAQSLGISTMTFLDPVPYARLAELMTESDLCLGSFGTPDRAGRVIPNKVFDALAVGRPVLTADTPAIREALVHGEHVWTCAPGDAAALADAIIILRRDRDLCRRLAENGHQLFLEQFSLAATTRNLAEIVRQLVREHSAHSVSR
jgi:glycosyltransferase involved in cell wall biosynthesis